MVTNSGTSVRADRLRSLNLPQPVRVIFANAATPVDRAPAAVSYGDTWYRVESIGEVWRVDDEWWRHPVSRRYIDVMLQGGAHLALYEDLVSGEWFVQRV
jgi:hypothetical protein